MKRRMLGITAGVISLYAVTVGAIGTALWLSPFASLLQTTARLLYVPHTRFRIRAPVPVVFSPMVLDVGVIILLIGLNIFLYASVSRQQGKDPETNVLLAHLSVVTLQLLLASFFTLGYLVCFVMSLFGLTFF